ncbi:hypothetical protein [Arthrobacter sp. NPDC089319]|uniref:hypothetical protein n=1 Tax=Arthrobacter sp. NPDC089319 TaxID=3155915 RepID=UPI003417BA7F
MPAPSSSPASRPIAIKIIAAAVALEALALLAGAALYGYGLATQTPISLAGSLFLLVLMLVFGIWLLVVGHFLFRGYRWTRAAALVWQVFVVVVAISMIQGGQLALGPVLLVAAGAAFVLLLTKPVTAFLVKGAAPRAL